jgi:outer membrane immunogenic protein
VAAPAYISEWAGFYVGIHGGGGWGHTDFDPLGTFLGETPSPQPNASSSGGVFGFQFGHNWQWGPVVGGLEIDFSGADIKESTTFFSPFDTDTFTREVRIEELASARGRLGYLIFPNWLLYGTAGIGWANLRLNLNEAEPGEFFSSTTFANEFGWVAGVGLEWKFWDHWMLRGEWLHYDFGRVTHNDAGFIFPRFGEVDTRTTIDVARAALSYKF